jgi:putative ABC transport system substrate-binding protein
MSSSGWGRFLTGIIIAATIALAHAQQPSKAVRIGWLSAGAPSSHATYFAAFRDALRAAGRVEGRDITIDIKYAEGDLSRLPELAAAIVAQRPAVIVTAGTPATRAASLATTTIPIVTASGGDPVGQGFTRSLARPERNVTGVANQYVELMPKYLELLHTMAPKAERIGVLEVPANPLHATLWADLEKAARVFKLTLVRVQVKGAAEYATAFASMVKQRAGAVVVLPYTVGERETLVRLTMSNRLPAIFGFREFVEAGALMSYGMDLHDGYRRAALYVVKVLKGAKVADLPFEQASKLELAINLKAAKALGLAVPREIFLRADKVIE